MVDYLMVILTATLASIGTAGVPGVGLIMLAMVLEQVGLPVEGIALIIGVIIGTYSSIYIASSTLLLMNISVKDVTIEVDEDRP